MKIPKKFHKGTPKKMTDDLVELGKWLLTQGNSERYTARALGVSRHTVRIYCKDGYKEWFRGKYKCYSYVRQNPNYMESVKKNALRRYHILCKFYPKEMKAYRKKAKQKMGKKYFRDYMRKYRKENKRILGGVV